MDLKLMVEIICRAVILQIFKFLQELNINIMLFFRSKELESPNVLLAWNRM